MSILTNLLCLEGPGDMAGSDALQGGPFGYGKYRQLANPKRDEDLVDPEEEKNHIYGALPIQEREASDILYRDLPGNVPMNTLANPQPHIPVDVDSDEINMDKISLTSLIPMGKPEKFGYGPMTPTKPKFETANDWKSTSGENMQPVSKDGVQVKLVKKVDWFSDDNLDNLSGFNKLHDEDDVNTRPGNMANLVSPKKFIPEPAPVYESEKTMKAKESKKLNDLEVDKKQIPTGKEVKPKIAGQGLGSVNKTEEFLPKNESEPKPSKKTSSDKNEKMQPYKGSSEVLVDPESFTLVKETIDGAIKEFFNNQQKVGNAATMVQKKIEKIPGMDDLLAAVKQKGDAAVVLSQLANGLGGDNIKASEILKKALSIVLNAERTQK